MMKGARRYFGLPDDTPAKSSFDSKADERAHEQAAPDERAVTLSCLRWLQQLFTGRDGSRDQQR